MTLIEAIILGIVQGLTEFLPVSSSGHLEIASALLGVQGEENLAFTTVVHGGTVLSTIVVFWKYIGRLLSGFFKFKPSPEFHFCLNLLVSCLPILLVGTLLKEPVESLFSGNLLLVGAMLLVTGVLLTFAQKAAPRHRTMTLKEAFIVGIAQALAVIPGLSRSGATISTGLMLGIKREEVASFSFLMALIPIIGANLLELFGGGFAEAATVVGAGSLLAGFVASFVAGTLACRLMIRLVQRGNLIGFAFYCAVIGLIAIGVSLF
ncbi:MAG: undecaprenyl-diphosphate phosphatase [Rikenellaceae bacterium]|jgi:undecaprenyl-diphosphatase|nr:undecaprenyl-diphosphate phosphatase [Rikenellaceae bacterium]